MNNRNDLVRDLKDYAIVNNNNLVMTAAEEIEVMDAELYSKRTGQALLDLERERELADSLAKSLETIIADLFLEEDPIAEPLKMYYNMRSGKAAITTRA